MSDSDWSIDPEDEPSDSIHAQQMPGYEEREEQSPVGMYGNQMGGHGAAGGGARPREG
jgi:hypothetical protein